MTFEEAFALVVGEEGKYSQDPGDKGNWTGGVVGAGQLKGTKYGISAAAYPSLDIANLTLGEAQALAKQDYWDKFRGDEIGNMCALGIFDAAYNEGIIEAIRLAQRALGVYPDGVMGGVTLGALQNVNVHRFARQFAIERIFQYALLAYWVTDHAGWTGRVLDVYARMNT